jgi:hypothetical protein
LHLTVLSVPGCPNAALLEERLAEAIGPRADVRITRQPISNEEDAARWGMHGSPTLLVNGTDPFASPLQPASLSCRLYQHPDGRADGAPSSDQILSAIGAHGQQPD